MLVHPELEVCQLHIRSDLGQNHWILYQKEPELYLKGLPDAPAPKYKCIISLKGSQPCMQNSLINKLCVATIEEVGSHIRFIQTVSDLCQYLQTLRVIWYHAIPIHRIYNLHTRKHKTTHTQSHLLLVMLLAGIFISDGFDQWNNKRLLMYDVYSYMWQGPDQMCRTFCECPVFCKPTQNGLWNVLVHFMNKKHQCEIYWSVFCKYKTTFETNA